MGGSSRERRGTEGRTITPRRLWKRFTAATTLIERLVYLGAVLVLGVVTGVRFAALQRAKHAGHADPSYYFQTARNLVQGRGFTNDFIWHFLVLPPAIHHYAGDYWQPLPSFLLALPMWITGDDSLVVAVSASIIAATLGTISSGFLAWNLTRQHLIAGMTVALVALLPRIGYFSVQAESVPFYLLFVMTALALATWRRGGTWRWIGVGAFAGAAWLCRNDGLLVVLVLGASMVLALPRAWRVGRSAVYQQLRWILAYGVSVLAVLAPWLVENERAMHRLLPPTTQLPFLQQYEQLFEVDRHSGLHDIFAAGVWKAVVFRWDTGFKLYRVTLKSMGSTLTWVLVGLALLNLIALFPAWRRRRKRKQAESAAVAAVGTTEAVDDVEAGPATEVVEPDEAAPELEPARWRFRAGWPTVAGCGLTVFLFDVIVSPIASLGGAWARSYAAYLPILVIAALLGVSRLPWGRTLGWSAMIVVLIWPLFGAVSPAALAVGRNNGFGDDVLQYADLITKAEAMQPGVIMTREPWEVTENTGYPSIQIPDNDFCTVAAIAKRYGATVFITHESRPLVTRAILRKHGFTLVGRNGHNNVMLFPKHITGC